jgi:7TMR-DISM extracellular 2
MAMLGTVCSGPWRITMRGLTLALRLLISGYVLLALCQPAAARELDFAKVGQETLNLNAYASWAEDRSGALTFDLARSDKGPLTFKEIPGGAWNADFDRSSSAYWVKLPIFNSGNKAAGRLLVMAQPLLEHIEVFCEAPDGSLRGTKTGHGMAFESRPYPHRLLIIPFELGPREGQTVWLRVKSPFSADLSAQLWDAATFQASEHADAMRYGWIGGLCAALALVFAFLWAATGQKAFAWFLGTDGHLAYRREQRPTAGAASLERAHAGHGVAFAGRCGIAVFYCGPVAPCPGQAGGGPSLP